MKSHRALLSVLLGLLACGAPGPRPSEQAELAKQHAQDLALFQGTWVFESVIVGGETLPADLFKEMSVTFDGAAYSVKVGDLVVEAATMTIDPSQSPKTLDAKVTAGPNEGASILGIYEISADTLRACVDPDGKERPMEFKADSGSRTLVVHKRLRK
ncbi:MAG: TIGR03067 domain-containing protein [Planctomycetota bacterium]